MNNPELLDTLFRQAVAAIDAGDAVTLERLLAGHPRLVRDRLESPGDWLRSQIGGALDGFFRHPYLLWFVTEDAVRTGQLSVNVAEIARVIIQAARRAGVTDLQQQLDSTLHFTVCSPIGREDGRQLELLDVLIDAGASTDGAAVQALICYNVGKIWNGRRQPTMPAFRTKLTRNDVWAIVEYVKTLRKARGRGAERKMVAPYVEGLVS